MFLSLQHLWTRTSDKRINYSYGYAQTKQQVG